MKIEHPDITQKAGMIQFFEMTFELSWNVMKDYFEEQGFIEVNTPRAAIKKAFEVNLISQGHLWLQLLNDRNLNSHIYDESIASEIEVIIRNKYFSILKELQNILKSKL